MRSSASSICIHAPRDGLLAAQFQRVVKLSQLSLDQEDTSIRQDLDTILQCARTLQVVNRSGYTRAANRSACQGLDLPDHADSGAPNAPIFEDVVQEGGIARKLLEEAPERSLDLFAVPLAKTEE